MSTLLLPDYEVMTFEYGEALRLMIPKLQEREERPPWSHFTRYTLASLMRFPALSTAVLYY
jgi:hypothetical protein